MTLSRDRILFLFDKLNCFLAEEKIKGELYLVGGAVMCLSLQARPSTKDIDSYFVPAAVLRRAAQMVADEEDLNPNWLNDAVKGYLSDNGEFKNFLDLSNLKVLVATPEYLLAMKCLSMRLGKEFHDEVDVRFLLRYLNIERYDDAISTISKFYPHDRFPQKTLNALEEMLSPKR